MILLDTNIVSEWNKPRPDPGAIRFKRGLDQDRTYLSAITVGELEYGVARLPTGNRKSTLAEWLRRFEGEWLNRVLSIDFETAQIWGELVARLHTTGDNIKPSDSWIAATALRHGMTIATRNTRDFQQTGVFLVNPWIA